MSWRWVVPIWASRQTRLLDLPAAGSGRLAEGSRSVEAERGQALGVGRPARRAAPPCPRPHAAEHVTPRLSADARSAPRPPLAETSKARSDPRARPEPRTSSVSGPVRVAAADRALHAGLDRGRHGASGAAARGEVGRLEARRASPARVRGVHGRRPRQVHGRAAGAARALPRFRRGGPASRRRCQRHGWLARTSRADPGSPRAVTLAGDAPADGDVRGHALPAQAHDVDVGEGRPGVGDAVVQRAVQLALGRRAAWPSGPPSVAAPASGSRTTCALARSIGHPARSSFSPVTSASTPTSRPRLPMWPVAETRPSRPGTSNRSRSPRSTVGLHLQVGTQRAHAPEAAAGGEGGAQQPATEVEHVDVEPRWRSATGLPTGLAGSSSRPRSHAPPVLATSTVPVPTLPLAFTPRSTRLPWVGWTYVTVPPVTDKLRINSGLRNGGGSPARAAGRAGASAAGSPSRSRGRRGSGPRRSPARRPRGRAAPPDGRPAPR